MFQRMEVIQVSHDVRYGKNFSRNLFCDARLTKDGVTLIPVHKIILASFSSKFKKIFESEDGGGGLTVVPVVDFPNLKRVINFIYDGKVTVHSKEELGEFLDALALLKVHKRIPRVELKGRNLQVEVKHKVTTMESSEQVIVGQRVKPIAMPYNLHPGEHEALWRWTTR